MAFEHLSLPQRINSAKYNSPYGKGKIPVVIEPSPETLENQNNRGVHGEKLRNKTERLITEWIADFENRNATSLPALPEAIPIFLQVDPKVFAPDKLRSFGIEVIAEQADGYLIGASADLNLSKLTEKIQKFVNQEGKFKDTASQLWDIVTGKGWRIENILSKDLFAKWETINDSDNLVVDIAIACHVKVGGAFPEKRKANLEEGIEEESEEEYQVRVNRWEQKYQASSEERDDLAFERQGELERFIQGHAGEIISSYVDTGDSFSCRIKISGEGLKDLLLNYPYLFEVEEYDELKQFSGSSLNDGTTESVTIIPPTEDAPKICIIDSGIQEDHRLISPAINPNHSKSYVPNEENVTSDQVVEGGHGTRVAGAALYETIPFSNDYSLKSWVQNARILNGDNKLDEKLFPPTIVQEIVDDFHSVLGTRIFNMSINRTSGFLKVRMSTWAESIDQEIWNNDIMFIISSGNLYIESLDPHRPGIIEFRTSGLNYPDYLFNKKSRIADPAQSLLSLTVGSICLNEFEDADVKSFGKKDFPSAFSRCGLGIWDSIKPEVVEYGGDFVSEKLGSYPNISLRNETSCTLIRSSLSNGPAYASDGVGTSYTAPKVSAILARLQSLFPDESSLLYKALLIQSARWPDLIFSKPATLNYLKLYGYGIPNLTRATQNSDWRVTLVNSNSISPKQADIYEVKIPENIRRLGDTFDILIEVTLTFKANPRRTRVGFDSYLSGWVDWQCSNFGESIDAFKNRITINESQPNTTDTDEENDESKIPWIINSRSNSGIKGVKLNKSTSQKDWAIIKSHNLGESFCIGVVGHKGWEEDLRHELPYSIVISFEAINQDIEIYNNVRVENQIQIQNEIQININPDEDLV
nr:S8 family peptidase [uncultured Fluviicola sp.]